MDKSLNTFKSDGEIDFRQGMLSSITDELTRLLLNLDAGHFKKMLDETRNIVLEQDDEIKKKENVIKELESKVGCWSLVFWGVFIEWFVFFQLTVSEVELTNVKEELEQARGDLTQSTDRDEVVAKAQSDRDAANAKRTKAEIELAKTRVELMQANSQLLESIQQKVELSQQLEQWQVRIGVFCCY